MNLASYTTYVVWVNFINDSQDLQFKIDYELQIFSWEIDSLPEFLPFTEEICFHIFVLMSDLGFEPNPYV